MSTSGYDCVSSSEPSTSSLGSNSNDYGGSTDFSQHRDDATDVLNYENYTSSTKRRRLRKQMPTVKQRERRVQNRKKNGQTKLKLAKNYGKIISKEIPIGMEMEVKSPRIQMHAEIRSRIRTNAQREVFSPIQNVLNANIEYDCSSPESPINVESYRYSASVFECPIGYSNQIYSNTNTRAPSLTPPISDECYGTGSDDHQIHELEISDDDQTDFINATNKIYENLSMEPVTFPVAQPKVSDLKSLPPVLPPEVHPEDEASLYGRLTALLFVEARNEKTTRQKIVEVQEELKILFNIPSLFDVCVDNEPSYRQNCAFLGNLVAYSLRQTRAKSPEAFAAQVKKLHKLLYGLKKKNAFLSGVGRFVQRLFRTI
ncbi:unnamed protein product [Bursaphelenchus xylophilus]|uniref:(pine wood nematode) hypothetical protein n=1 Tax=Bursaphelenchus xylophilus TaxID=6326 RepID=A0A1I7S4U4_BURXY|nr:unnamed protein product [Bursaphelenchus xylophilus]CAG9117382.1 unnamed protein product [Bursaphelenchus xylophilus]